MRMPKIARAGNPGKPFQGVMSNSMEMRSMIIRRVMTTMMMMIRKRRSLIEKLMRRKRKMRLILSCSVITGQLKKDHP